jgi:hypothetical protein
MAASDNMTADLGMVPAKTAFYRMNCGGRYDSLNGQAGTQSGA